MADRVRKSLVWDIRKRLLNLSAVELFQVAKSISPIPERDFSELDTEDQEGCLEYVNAFMYSTHLLESEDRGMTELLVLQGSVEAVVQEHGAAAPCHRHGEVESNVDVDVCPAPTPYTHTSTGHMITTDTVHVELPKTASDLGKVRGLDTNPCTNPTVRHSDFEELSRKLIQYLTPHTQHSNPSSPVIHNIDTPRSSNVERTSQGITDKVVSLRELSCLQRREFKIQGGQIGDYASDITYASVCRQIDDGVKENFSEAELVRGILRAIKPGNFKEMIMNKEDMTVEELKKFLQSHLGEKSSTELFQELMCAKQMETETPQQFLYRVIGLKQKILFAIKQSNTDVRYSPATIQDVFLHTVYQGLGHKYKDVRSELKPLLADHSITDEAIVRNVMKITNDENERARRLGPITRPKQSHANSAQLESEPDRVVKEAPGQKIKNDPIVQLTARIDALTSMVDSMRQSTLRPQPEHTCQCFVRDHPPQRGAKLRGCPRCVEAGQQNCTHCFLCGEEGHRARGCLRKQRLQGNGKRPLPRDDQ